MSSELAITSDAEVALTLATDDLSVALVSHLRNISSALAGAADIGSSTAHQLAILAQAQLCKINADSPMDTADILQGISALMKMSGEAAKLGMSLRNAERKTASPESAAEIARTQGLKVWTK